MEFDINELNTEYNCLFGETKRGWEFNKNIKYVWGNVLSYDNFPAFYIDDNKNIIGVIDYKETTIKGFQGKMWYVDNIIVGFTRDSDNKYVTCQGLGLGQNMYGGYFIKGISESLKIIDSKKSQQQQKKQSAAEFFQLA